MARQGRSGGSRGDSAPPVHLWGKCRVALIVYWPIIKFIGTFAILMALFYGMFYRPPTEDSWFRDVFPWYLSKYAVRVGGGSSSGSERRSPFEDSTSRRPGSRFSIVRGCDAMEATALFVAAAIAFPAPILRRLLGVVAGVLALAGVNLVRIVSLYYVGVYWRDWFDDAHIEIWQPAFIVIAIVFWITWAWWATKPRVALAEAAKTEDAVTQTS